MFRKIRFLERSVWGTFLTASGEILTEKASDILTNGEDALLKREFFFASPVFASDKEMSPELNDFGKCHSTFQYAQKS